MLQNAPAEEKSSMRIASLASSVLSSGTCTVTLPWGAAGASAYLVKK
jgi:hypothetical protein